jgi:hypothetical protein
MRLLRFGSALAGALACLALSVAVSAVLWPHARDAGAIDGARKIRRRWPTSDQFCDTE